MEEQNTESWKKDSSKYKMVIKLVYRFKISILILINYETGIQSPFYKVADILGADLWQGLGRGQVTGSRVEGQREKRKVRTMCFILILIIMCLI